MKRLILFCLILCSTIPIVAQQNMTWEECFEQFYAESEIKESDKEEIFVLLSELAEHPLDLNTATREDLERIPFLNAQQIEDIQAYVYQYHGMRTLGELSMIESLDFQRRQLLSYFVYLSPVSDNKPFPSLKEILSKGHHTLLFTCKAPFYQRKGDINGYLGYPYKHSFRYNFHYNDYFQTGLIGAQDAGEPFFSNKNKFGYDHYSFYIQLRKLGKIRNLVLGRYKLSFGQGLVINNNLSFGKYAALSTLGRQTNGIRVYSSRSSINYLQGAAATIELAHNLDLTTFLSYRTIDATLTSNGDIKTILNTGYHRTAKEMERKDNASQFTTGGNLNWRCDRLTLGLTALFTHFDKALSPNTDLYYRRYAPSGNDFWNVGINYSYMRKRWSLAGETATCNGGILATINNISVQVKSNLSLLAMQRYYRYDYTGLFARSFAEGGKIQNENGLLLGTNWEIKHGLSLIAYTDYSYFSHPRFGSHTASRTWDNVLNIYYTHKVWSLCAGYKLKLREKDDFNKTALINEITQRGRFTLNYKAKTWVSKTQFDISVCHNLNNSIGYMASENVTWIPSSWLQLTALLGYFHTDDFSSRIYIYERRPLYSFSFPSFYGIGLHYALFARAELSPNLALILQSSTTSYFDRDKISSGLQQINGSTKSDLELQMRWKF
ncbi:MAG: helix-hairpin-helix domain-containing protein [Prevotella sp.]|nr:helix-hairpin-helix domain-containing protein [Prevotella sp.]